MLEACLVEAAQRTPATDGGHAEPLPDLVRFWCEAFDAQDPATSQHCRRVADYSLPLAAVLGFSGEQLQWFRIGALLHDLGKTLIAQDILGKPGQLSQDEWFRVRQHPAVGAQMLAAAGMPAEVASMIYSHHEHWDGGGYPDGLHGEGIPLAARVLCVADVYDALTSARSYRNTLSSDEALGVMASDTGIILDPALFAVFCAIIR